MVTSNNLQTMGLKVEEYIDNRKGIVYAFYSIQDPQSNIHFEIVNFLAFIHASLPALGGMEL